MAYLNCTLATPSSWPWLSNSPIFDWQTFSFKPSTPCSELYSTFLSFSNIQMPFPSNLFLTSALTIFGYFARSFYFQASFGMLSHCLIIFGISVAHFEMRRIFALI